MNVFKVSPLKLKTSIVSTNQPSLFALVRRIHSAPVLQDKTHYEILRISPESTQSEIKEAYYKLSKVFHPDVKKDESSLAMFRSITEAYDVLGNVKSRQEYDRQTFGKGEDYNSSKKPFYNALYRDIVRYNNRAPDFDELLNKRSKLEQYLQKEYKDRIGEVRMRNNRSYETEIKPLGHYGLERAVICMVLAMGYYYFKQLDEKYRWAKM